MDAEKIEQWKIKAWDGYTRVFDKFQGAKRQYGIWCKEIEKEQEGWVEMYYRKGIKAKFELLQEFRYSE
jgi:hypothetical protein